MQLLASEVSADYYNIKNPAVDYGRLKKGEAEGESFWLITLVENTQNILHVIYYIYCISYASYLIFPMCVCPYVSACSCLCARLCVQLFWQVSTHNKCRTLELRIIPKILINKILQDKLPSSVRRA